MNQTAGSWKEQQNWQTSSKTDNQKTQATGTRMKPEPSAGGSACDPSYSWGRDQENGGSKSTQANSLWDPISKTEIKRRASGVAQHVVPECKP
jgi:hypothetical protein